MLVQRFDEKWIIFDRDGTLIRKDTPVIKKLNYCPSAAEVVLCDGIMEALSTLSVAGYRFVVATNQACVGRSYVSIAQLHAIHERMNEQLHVESAGLVKIEKFYTCPHTPEDNCCCRKPKPGLLAKICFDLQLFPSKMIYVGDSDTDMAAADAINARGIYMKDMMKKVDAAVRIFDEIFS